MYLFFGEGEHAWVVLLIIFIGIVAGILAPILLIVASVVYNLHLHYKFTWEEELVNRDKNETT